MRTLSPSRTTKSINSPATRALITALLTALMLPVKGTPTVKARLLELAAQYGADELSILTITGDYASRRRSYQLLAAAFGLAKPAMPADKQKTPA